jgi:hypothetical protein
MRALLASFAALAATLAGCTHTDAGADGGGGACSAVAGTPTVLATANAPWQVAVDATHVYWATQKQGPVFSVPIAGGAVTTLDGDSSFTLALGGTNVYSLGPYGVYACAKTGCSGTPTEIVSNFVEGMGLAVDATSIYFAGPGLMKAPLGGGSASVLAASSAYEIALDDANVYWTDDTGFVLAVPKAGGSYTQLATGQGPAGIAVDGTNVYYTTSDGTVWKVAKDGSSPAVALANDAGNEPWGIAVDATDVYYVTNEKGTVEKVPIAGGCATILASGQAEPQGIAVDGSNVYWTNAGDGTVMKLAK